MIRNATIFRHSIPDSSGTIGQVLRQRDIDITLVDSFFEPLHHFDPLAPDLLVVLGGACGVYQSDHYPFLKDELNIIRRRLQADRPTLGICLGAQLMAGALGQKVYKGAQGSEIGWHAITMNEKGRDSVVRHFDFDRTHVMQWHGDTFDLPPEATLLATGTNYQNQIFSIGKRAIGLQCHIEVTPYLLQNWFVGAAHAVHDGKVDLPVLQADTEKWSLIMQAQAELFLNEWLDLVGEEL